MLRRLTRTPTPARRPSRPLALEALESREVPALLIQFDYSHDTNGFFTDPARRAALEQAAADIGSHITSPLAPITPAGGNYWTGTFFNPATGLQDQVSNLAVPANGIVL